MVDHKRLHTMPRRLCLFFALAVLFLCACQPAPPPCQWPAGAPRYLTSAHSQDVPVATPGPSPTPVSVKIGNSTIRVNKVIEGPLCNDTWTGTVYVGCNVQVYPWEKEPLFFKDCNLKIEPGTIVYVAYHNNTAYYNGCSCHSEPSTKR